MDRQRVAINTMQAVKALGARSGIFQSQDVRERCDYGEQSDEGHYMHNVIARLKKQGILAVEGDKSRKRNQYLRLAQPDRLQERLDKSRGNGSRPVVAAVPTVHGNGSKVTTAPKRVRFLEERIEVLEQQVGTLDQRAIDDIRDQLKAMDQKINDLVELWS